MNDENTSQVKKYENISVGFISTAYNVDFIEKYKNHEFISIYWGKRSRRQFIKEDIEKKLNRDITTEDFNEIIREMRNVSIKVMKTDEEFIEDQNKLKIKTKNNEEFIEDQNKLKINTKNNEKFYQTIVEKYLGGKHKRMLCGITDVTTDKIHAEIKNWTRYNDTFGQLFRYNNEDPKERLQVYMFGNTKKNKQEQQAFKSMKAANFEVYTFVHKEEHVDIIEYESKKVMYTYYF
jgi:hypothetical protein